MRFAAGLLFASLLATLLVVALPRPALAAAAGVADCLEVPLVTNRIDCLSRAAIAADDVGLCLESSEAAARWPCVARFADQAEDPEVCQILTDAEDMPAGVSRDLCRVYLAISWREPELCQDLSAPVIDDACIYQYVETGGDPAYCDRIANPNLKEVCGDPASDGD